MKPLNALAMSQLADQIANRWHVKIDPKVNPIDHLFMPQFWVHCSRLASGDLIRVQAPDGSYDFQLKVDARTIAGKPAVRVSIYPNLPAYVIAASAASTEIIPTMVNGRPVPRVDFTRRSDRRAGGIWSEIAVRHGWLFRQRGL